MNAEAAVDEGRESLSSLGAGGAGDRLHFRLVLRILLRCLRLLVPVRGHVIRLVVGFSAVAVALAPIGFLLFDLFWTRALQGEREYGPDVMQLLYIANRYERKADLQRWLDGGLILVCDRYVASSIAYGEAQGLSGAWLATIQGFLPPPHGLCGIAQTP